MKIWFGHQKDKAVKDLSDVDLTSLSGWITGIQRADLGPGRSSAT